MGEETDFEFTDRELAIIQGNDPDDVDETVVPETTKADTAATGDADSTSSTSAAASGEASPWWGDDERSLASTYGLGDDDLKGFRDADDFRRTTSFLERALKSQKPSTPGGETPTVPASASAGEQKPDAESEEDIALDVQKFIDSGYDEDTVAVVKVTKRLQETLKAREKELAELMPALDSMKQFQQAQEEFIRRKAFTDFHNAADELDPDLFGQSVVDEKPVELGKEHDDNRRRLYEEAARIERGLIEQHKPVPAMPVLLKGAFQRAFAEELRQQDRKEYQRKIADQARRRRPAPGRARASKEAAVAGNRDEAAVLANHPDVVSLWNKFQESNGTAA